MLGDIQAELTGLVRTTWAADVMTWGQRVALYRAYAAGDHRARLTDAMRSMLRLGDSHLDRFNANYCGLIAQAMGDRLTVTSVEGETPEATRWAMGVMDHNRFDSLQMDIHESVLIDGDTFLMAAWSEDESMVIWAHEPAFDGEVGVIPVYDRMRRRLVAAVKIWWEGDAKLVNLYLPGKIKKYVWSGVVEPPASALVIRGDAADWTDTAGAALGVPLVHFKNRASTYAWHGASELVNAIPLQDVLNRTITSMVMTSELSAFPIPIAKGFTPPAALMPGTWITITTENGLTKDDLVEVDVLPQASLVPFINQAEFTIDQISSVTQTPLMSAMGGSSSSGEALKQRETGLIGKVRRAQTRLGNAWEDAIAMAARLQRAYGTATMVGRSWRAMWQDASPRNDKDVIDNALKVRELVGDTEALRLIAPVYGYDEAKITALQAERDAAVAVAMRQLSLPGFEMLGRGTDLDSGPTLPEGVPDAAAIEAALAA